GLNSPDPMGCADENLAQVRLVDEELWLDGLCDSKLDWVVSHRGHQDRAAGGERPDQLDPLEVAVPPRPARDVGPQPPDSFRGRGGLNAVLVRPHRVLLHACAGHAPTTGSSATCSEGRVVRTVPNAIAAPTSRIAAPTSSARW